MALKVELQGEIRMGLVEARPTCTLPRMIGSNSVESQTQTPSRAVIQSISFIPANFSSLGFHNRDCGLFTWNRKCSHCCY